MEEIIYKNRSWAEVDLDAIAHNLREIKGKLARNTLVMSVVKADAYGHGVFETVQTLLENGADRLAVSMLDEAIQLRKSGVTVPILILSYTDPGRAEELIQYDITQTVFSMELAKSLSEAAVALSKSIKVHIKIDTGMTRVGFTPGYDAVKHVVEISRLPGIVVEGLFTHFSKADEWDKSYTNMQFERFTSLCTELNRIGVFIPIKHVANSATAMSYPEMHLDMIRPGIIQYGLYPSDEVDKARLDLKPAMTLKSKVIMVKKVEAGVAVSYGGTFVTERETYIATLPIGYADGYSRLLSNKASVLIHGEYAKVIGNICMDQCMVDVTDLVQAGIPVSVGDEAVLFGKQGEKEITVSQLAEFMGTISYELVCIIGKRIPRIYMKNGKVANVLNYLLK